jgi:hypothetical protein
MDIFTAIVLIIMIPILGISFFQRNKPGATFGPKVCSRCNVELRGWNSSGRKQLWYRDDGQGGRIYYCARCKNK